MYECSLSGCQNKTEFDTEADDILVIERTTLTVRAHEPRSGTERCKSYTIITTIFIEMCILGGILV